MSSVHGVTDYTRGSKIEDVADPQTPALLGHLDSLRVQKVVVYEGYALLADDTNGVLVDVCDPITPRDAVIAGG